MRARGLRRPALRPYLRRSRLRRLLFLHFGLMMPNRATHGCADQAVAARYMTDHTSDGGAFNAAMGAGHDRQRGGRDR
jgi:hypothetical protein